MLPNMATNGNNFQAKLATKNLSENCYSKWSYKNKIQIILKTKKNHSQHFGNKWDKN